jgi:hypothetical protein
MRSFALDENFLSLFHLQSRMVFLRIRLHAVLLEGVRILLDTLCQN